MMEPQTKKKVIVIGSLLVIVGIIGYILWKRQKDAEKELTDTTPKDETPKDETPKDDSQSGGNIGSGIVSGSGSGSTPKTLPTDIPNNVLAFQKFANSKGWKPTLKEDGAWGSKTSSAWGTWGAEYNKTLKVSVAKPKVNATDVLASNIKGGNARSIYAIVGGLTIYNVNNQPTGKTTKGQRLGTIINATPTSKGYWINFLGSGNVKYKVMAIPNTYSIEM